MGRRSSNFGLFRRGGCWERVGGFGREETTNAKLCKAIIEAAAKMSETKKGEGKELADLVVKCRGAIVASGKVDQLGWELNSMAVLVMLRDKRILEAIAVYKYMQARNQTLSWRSGLELLEGACNEGFTQEAMLILDDLVDRHEAESIVNEDGKRKKFRLSAPLFNVVIKSLIEAKNVTSAVHVYNLAVSTYIEAGYFIKCLDVFKKAREKRISLKVEDMANEEVVQAFNEHVMETVERFEMAEREGDSAAFYGTRGQALIQRPSAEILRSLGGALAKVGDVDGALRVYRLLISSNERPTTRFSNTLIAALLAASRKPDAEGIFDVMPSRAATPALTEFSRNVETYRLFLTFAGTAGDQALVARYVDLMKDDGFSEEEMKGVMG
ncbi:hypothetical protein BC829DRAFT_385448 [Chytridium lagenaria]|nr:hypothetical protein BC829DRAFT_385448 [Chytridium lagenaria]